ncbi:TadE/TadG family type IV pilus assembly protein [Aeoliella mucimassa]|uniref:TadE-like protein n=1 Tax=Aeoliella mucimassa TaxID=2527972 RepID=A0A518AV60_9BACT|nr:TadE/TadG family type IV pilus assembly protein [Aeoliella mucimassa]QDU58600.1 TadE-like protein [Aeoliella mucimassa]
MFQRLTRRQPSNRRGAVIVEFAICAPIFFMVIFALIEFSWLNVIRHTADNAAYEASRTAMVPGATADEAVAEAQRIMSAVGTRGATISVDPKVVTSDTSEVTVRVQVPVDNNLLLLPTFSRGRTIDTRATLRTERVETR